MTIEFPAVVELELENKPVKFELDFSICENPDCDCSGINMVLCNENTNVKFFLDFAAGSYRDNNYSENEARILDTFVDFLKSNEGGSLNFGFFKRDYDYVKEKVRTRRDTIKSFKPGIFLNYRDIIWREDDIKLKVNGKNYLVFDGYCVTPDCTCKSVALNFFEEVHRLGTRRADFSFVYNYISGSFRDSVGIGNKQTEEIIQTFPDALHKKFKKKHEKLSKEVKEDILRRIKKEGFVHRKRKLGRNEPCHCGSGKKYKKCCLDKDIKKYGGGIKI